MGVKVKNNYMRARGYYVAHDLNLLCVKYVASLSCEPMCEAGPYLSCCAGKVSLMKPGSARLRLQDGVLRLEAKHHT